MRVMSDLPHLEERGNNAPAEWVEAVTPYQAALTKALEGTHLEVEFEPWPSLHPTADPGDVPEGIMAKVSINLTAKSTVTLDVLTGNEVDMDSLTTFMMSEVRSKLRDMLEVAMGEPDPRIAAAQEVLGTAGAGDERIAKTAVELAKAAPIVWPSNTDEDEGWT